MKPLLPILALLLVLVGCQPQTGSDRPVVTVSIEPQKYLLEQIVGDKVEVKTLMASGGNPETYEPTFTHLMNVDNSLAYFRVGGLGFEEAILGKIQEANPDLKIYDTSKGIKPVMGTHYHGDALHVETEPDPHTWSSVKNARVIIRNMVEAMKSVDPDNSKYYQKNYERFDQTLDSLDKVYSARLLPHKNEAFLVWHPSLSYFARDYGLEQIAVGQEAKESSVRDLQDAIDHAVDHRARVFFFQKEYDSRQAEAVNEKVGGRRVDINPLSPDWLGEMDRIVNALTDGK